MKTAVCVSILYIPFSSLLDFKAELLFPLMLLRKLRVYRNSPLFM